MLNERDLRSGKKIRQGIEFRLLTRNFRKLWGKGGTKFLNIRFFPYIELCFYAIVKNNRKN